jgi:glycosyltransferase involved in cell wall biosynthesis
MHALFLTEKYPPVVGGGESHIRDLAHGLVANGHQVTVLTETPGWVDSAERTGPVDFHEVPGLLEACARLHMDTALRSLHQALSHFPDADLLHVFNRVPALLTGLVRDQLPATVCLSAFETVMPGRRVFGLWNDFQLEMSYSRAVGALLRPDAVICGSGLYRSWTLDEGYPPERIHVVYHGTDMAQFRPDSARRAGYRRRYGWTDEFVVLVAARPIPRKRIEDVVDAVAKGRADWPDVRLVLTAPTNRGVDSYVRDLERRIERAGLGDRVSWLRGLSVDDMAELTRAADVSVLPAADDGFGIVLIEAMAGD